MRAKSLIAMTVAAVSLTLLSAPIFAHHGAAAYDLTRTITSKATVTNLNWAQPHCILSFDIKSDIGEVTHWSVEMYGPLYLTRSGWKKDTLKPGDEIMITFNPARNGVHNGIVREGQSKIVLNGQALDLTEH